MKLIPIIALGVLGACSPSFDLGMKIDRISAPSSTLIGSITRHPKAGLSFTGILFEASDGSISCEGETLDGKWSLSGLRDKYRYKFPISCSDGSRGELDIRLSLPPGNGMGVGRMADGSKLKMIVG